MNKLHFPSSFSLHDLAGCSQLDDPFYLCHPEPVNYGDFLQKVSRLSSYLTQHKSDDAFIGLQLSNPLDTLIAVFALWNCAKCPVLLSPVFPAKHLQALGSQVPFGTVMSEMPEYDTCEETEWQTLTKDQNGLVVFRYR